MELTVQSDGLVVRDVRDEQQRIRIPYAASAGPQLSTDSAPVPDEVNSSPAVEIFGLLGSFKLGPGFVVAVTGREQVTVVAGKPIHVVTKTLIVPLQYNAAKDIVVKAARAQAQAQSSGRSESGSDTEGTDGTESEDPGLGEVPHAFEAQAVETSGQNRARGSNTPGTPGLPGTPGTPVESIIERVLVQRKSSIVLSNWDGTDVGESDERSPPILEQADGEGTQEIASESTNTGSGAGQSSSGRAAENRPGTSLIPKFIRCVKALFESRSFYYSDLDLTNDLTQTAQGPRESLLFNKKMLENLALLTGYRDSTGSVLGSLGIAVIQGFVGTAEIAAGARLVLISRRSTKRNGVRYMRRGVDKDGNCANWVETEQALIVNDDDIMSFTQVRGSIPVYFTQSPYQLKPTPKISQPESRADAAFQKHFGDIQAAYGEVVGVQLIERPPSGEGAVGELYEKLAAKHGVYLEWFDFHAQCKGMRFENVQKLLTETRIGEKLEASGWTEKRGSGDVVRRQSGVLRVNCIDCLDRTNVVETECASAVLKKQLASRGIEYSDRLVGVFAGLWADNGDAISRQYSSTNALKGDFTRTRHRNYRGLLTDAYLTLTRYYHGMITDFFTQAVLDYVLGNVGDKVFVEFEQYLRSTDPAIDVDSIKQSCIAIAWGIVAESEDEVHVGGWSVLGTARLAADTPVRGARLRERLVLVSNAAVYICQFDIKNERVEEYWQIPAGSVRAIQHGKYFTKLTTRLSKDEQLNVGVVISYEEDGVLYSSVETGRATGPSTGNGTGNGTSIDADSDTGTGNDAGKVVKIGLKQPLLQDGDVADLVKALTEVCANADFSTADIVSSAEAYKDTTFWGLLGYRMKRAVWS